MPPGPENQFHSLGILGITHFLGFWSIQWSLDWLLKSIKILYTDVDEIMQVVMGYIFQKPLDRFLFPNPNH